MSLLPILQRWQQELRNEYPNVTTNIYDCGVGGLTRWQGHDIGIECTLKSVAPEWPDSVVLSVSLKHLHDQPSIHSADVAWENGHVEEGLLPASVEFSRERLATLVERLPELFTALREAIRRGQPEVSSVKPHYSDRAINSFMISLVPP